MFRTVTTLVSAITLSAGLVTLAAPAQAGDGGEVRRSGSCSGSTDWKLKAKHDDGRIEVEGEIDSNRIGQTWRWRLVHNGSLSARGTRQTQAPSGSFSVERRVVDLAGQDKLVFKARQPRSGETCRGVVRL
jgi:hypothetical protein